MVRLGLLIACLSGCATQTHGTAWPKAAASETDGGESLAPHQARSVAAVSDDDAAKPALSIEKPDAPAAAAEAAKPTITPVTPATGDESLFGDDLEITIED